MPSGLRHRFWLESISGSVTGIIAIITLLWHDWIEAVFGTHPDTGPSPNSCRNTSNIAPGCPAMPRLPALVVGDRPAHRDTVVVASICSRARPEAHARRPC